MNENWNKSHNPLMLSKVFTDPNGRKILFEVALADISTNLNIDLDELAHNALKKKHQERVEKYRFTGSHFEPE